MSTPQEHQGLAISRLATQYRQSGNLIGYIRALLKEANTLEEVLQSVIADRWLDTAVGAQLDIIGSLVGQPRVLIDANTVAYFGFDGEPGAQSFGDLNNNSVGGRFRGIDEPTTGNRILTDDEYRLFIRARIVKNSIYPNVENMAAFFRFLFNVDTVRIIDQQDMSYTVEIGRILDDNEKQFLQTTNLVPKVAAVRSNYTEFPSDEAFSFASDPSGLGFGDLNNPAIGGVFSSVITT